MQQRSTLAELATPAIKYVVWNADMSMVAMTSKHAIIIADKKLQNAQTVSMGTLLLPLSLSLSASASLGPTAANGQPSSSGSDFGLRSSPNLGVSVSVWMSNS